jgi:hypothetical protein
MIALWLAVVLLVPADKNRKGLNIHKGKKNPTHKEATSGAAAHKSQGKSNLKSQICPVCAGLGWVKKKKEWKPCETCGQTGSVWR